MVFLLYFIQALTTELKESDCFGKRFLFLAFITYTSFFIELFWLSTGGLYFTPLLDTVPFVLYREIGIAK